MSFRYNKFKIMASPGSPFFACYSDHVPSVHTKNIHIQTPNSLHTSIKLGGFGNDNGAMATRKTSKSKRFQVKQ